MFYWNFVLQLVKIFTSKLLFCWICPFRLTRFLLLCRLSLTQSCRFWQKYFRLRTNHSCSILIITNQYSKQSWKRSKIWLKKKLFFVLGCHFPCSGVVRSFRRLKWNRNSISRIRTCPFGEVSCCVSLKQKIFNL